MYQVEFMDGEEFTVTEELYTRLKADLLVYDCDDCSSEFSARLVCHPNIGAAGKVRKLIHEAINGQTSNR